MTEEKNIQNEKYLMMLFSMMKKKEAFALTSKKTHFNSTELRMLAEIIEAKYMGTRIISTQIAQALGITRSAVSQMINRMEEQGVVKRVADEVDRKIAYIEITEEALSAYSEDIQEMAEFAGKAVRNFGEAKFLKLYERLDAFMAQLEKQKSAYEKRKKAEEKKKRQ